jgi:hypothetical protein
MQFSHHQAIGCLIIIGLTHPSGLDLWLWQFNQMITLPQPLAATKIGTALPRSLLPKDPIHTPLP